MNTADNYEVCYRRMCEDEAVLSRRIQGLPKGRAKFKKGGIIHSSEPHKWITYDPGYAITYQPKGSQPSDYPLLTVFYVAPGTIDALKTLRSEGRIRRGCRNTFGITEEFTSWFNRRVIDTAHFDLRRGTPQLPSEQDGIQYLMNDGYFVLFQAFSPQYIDGSKFSDQIKLNRMSWLKTSLLWLLYRSDWGRAEGQERILEIRVTREYISHLEQSAVSTKDPAIKNADILVQVDPDRRLIGWIWQGRDPNYWVNAGRTVQFGVRGPEFANYLNISDGKVKDITDIVQEVERTRPEHPRATLYNLLGYVAVHQFIKQND